MAVVKGASASYKDMSKIFGVCGKIATLDFFVVIFSTDMTGQQWQVWLWLNKTMDFSSESQQEPDKTLVGIVHSFCIFQPHRFCFLQASVTA